jgi:hypothetical protein
MKDGLMVSWRIERNLLQGGKETTAQGPEPALDEGVGEGLGITIICLIGWLVFVRRNGQACSYPRQLLLPHHTGA